MPKWHSYITRFLLLAASCTLGISVLLFFLSSYLFSEVADTALMESISSTLNTGEALLCDYTENRIDEALLKERVNPVFNSGGEFVLLMDRYGKVIAYTDSSLPYLMNEQVEELIYSVQQSGQNHISAFRLEGQSTLIAGRAHSLALYSIVGISPEEVLTSLQVNTLSNFFS